MNLLIEASLKWSVLIVAVWAVCALLSRKAAWRHLGWAIATAAGIPIVVLAVIAPPLELPVSWMAAPETHPALTVSFEAPRTNTVPIEDSRSAGPLFFLWLAGACLLAAWTCLGVILSWLLARGASPVSRPAPLQARGIPMRASHRVTLPVTVGLIRPTIIVPASAVGWPEPMWNAALLHEAAHAGRRDVLFQILGSLSRALHWPNPLAWLALFRLRQEAELAADDAVVGQGVDAADYARILLETGRSAGKLRAPLISAAMSRGSLSRRITSVLRSGRRAAPARGHAALGSMLMAILVVSIALVRPVPVETTLDPLDGSRVALGVGESLDLSFETIRRVAVGSPDLLDVKVRSQRVRLHGLSEGTTTVLVWTSDTDRRSLLVTVGPRPANDETREKNKYLGGFKIPSSVETIQARVGDRFSHNFGNVTRLSYVYHGEQSLNITNGPRGSFEMTALAPGRSTVLVWQGGEDPAEALIVEVE